MIQKGKLVALNLKVTTLEDEEDVYESDPMHPVEFFQGEGMVLPAIEKNIEGLAPGDKFNLTLKPEDAYGDYLESLVLSLPVKEVEQKVGLKIGAQIEVDSELGKKILRVKRVGRTNVALDGNHPLAGKTLLVTGIVAGVREATEEESKKMVILSPISTIDLSKKEDSSEDEE